MFTPTRRFVTRQSQVRTFKVKVTHKGQTYLLAISYPSTNSQITSHICSLPQGGVSVCQGHTQRSNLSVSNILVRIETSISLNQFTNYFAQMFTSTRRYVVFPCVCLSVRQQFLVWLISSLSLNQFYSCYSIQIISHITTSLKAQFLPSLGFPPQN